MHALHDLYFENCNVYLPLLHRPTFQRNLQQGLHLTNDSFGATVLMMCALGAKFSDDPRTLLDGSSTHSSGWKWFKCVQDARRAFRSAPPCIYDLQMYAVSTYPDSRRNHSPLTLCIALLQMVAEFVHSSPLAGCSPVVIGAGVRTAQDLGAHRRKVYATLPADEGESLKRAFWYEFAYIFEEQFVDVSLIHRVLVSLDRIISSGMGRSCCIQDEE